MFFDRFMFNLHPADATTPSIILGVGSYPDRNSMDGFVIACLPHEQRNVRFGGELGPDSCGPLSWQALDPAETWHFTLGANPTDVEFDLTWRARTPAWSGDIKVGESTNFEHLFQSGLYDGVVSIDGIANNIQGWYGQRDRSRGVRTMSGGQGLHIWYQAQFPDRSIGFLLVEDRAGERLLLEGAVMHTDGRLDPIVDVRHDLRFDDTLDLRSGTVEVTTKAGISRIEADASGRGALMAGGGYGGQHGTVRGLESDVYPLDGTITPLTADTSLTDRLCEFNQDGTRGRGIFEFALTRSTSYTYRPTLR
ncbi:hypothetical protein EV643_110228 [Kribbella sp. VKM Ac-2527]|uniref:Uncharacterized protein n=1 Tax=Kribbella caucasensis TaxID=2512215 RepID=A0A4R6KAL1_9ACTN|nr:hypothetical protein [Kribbella sp. VKM Ac-2527]TDO46845.1 hypothetical protein EV643_110228 [Kribbella sp. VKM Ac-2527]